ncbi:MAG: thiamine-phosphate pyrophosphorylase [Candidatus Omnitrophota bacterium]|nr:thiamine-phosphate pyrophosphorylase [Candidatus Omnitrophota bacterium]
MQKIDKKIFRVLDANFNRTREGLRVCEDILRFVFNSKTLATEFKIIRHKVSSCLVQLNINLFKFLEQRDTLRDVGRKSFSIELKRKNIADIFFANIQRAKESIRVLEEFSKLINKKAAVNFKALRYKIYKLEKEAIKRFLTLSHLR